MASYHAITGAYRAIYGATASWDNTGEIEEGGVGDYDKEPPEKRW